MFANSLLELTKQLHSLLIQLTAEEYARPLAVFNGSSIGQHTRHLVEFFVELERGYAQGYIDYDDRRRNHQWENDPAKALEALIVIASAERPPDRLMQLVLREGVHQPKETVIATTYRRELAFVLEHAVHHMALIRIGAEQIRPLPVPDSFGVAASTQRFQAACAP